MPRGHQQRVCPFRLLATGRHEQRRAERSLAWDFLGPNGRGRGKRLAKAMVSRFVGCLAVQLSARERSWVDSSVGPAEAGLKEKNEARLPRPLPCNRLHLA